MSGWLNAIPDWAALLLSILALVLSGLSIRQARRAERQVKQDIVRKWVQGVFKLLAQLERLPRDQPDHQDKLAELSAEIDAGKILLPKDPTNPKHHQGHGLIQAAIAAYDVHAARKTLAEVFGTSDGTYDSEKYKRLQKDTPQALRVLLQIEAEPLLRDYALKAKD